MNSRSNNKPVMTVKSLSSSKLHAQSLNLLLLVIVSLPGLIWYRQTGGLDLYFTDAAPAGQFLYVLSKLSGMYALLCIALQIILGLADRLKLASRHRMRWLHPLLGSMVVLLALAHLLLFFTAVSLRQDAPAWGLLAPDFRDFYHTHLSLGLFGLWVLLVVMVTGIMRRFNSSNMARMLHRGYWLAITLVYLHALAIGTESQSPAGLLLYGLLGGVVLMMLLAWLIRRNRMMAAFSG